MASIRKSQSDRSAETSGKILRAAQKLFALRGFDGVTMRAIASEAGVNLASIVYYFENKEGIKLNPPKVNIRVDKLVREFILKGGFEID